MKVDGLTIPNSFFAKVFDLRTKILNLKLQVLKASSNQLILFGKK